LPDASIHWQDDASIHWQEKDQMHPAQKSLSATGGTMFKTLRAFALLVVLGLGVALAQSDDGTVLSPNLPLPNPLGFLPITTKPQPAPAASSVQPAAPVVVTTPAAPVVTAPKPATPTTSSAPTSSTPISAPRPVSEPVAPAKPVEIPSSLILPIPSNIAAPKPATPVVPRIAAPAPSAPKPVAVAPKPAPKPVTATPKPAPKPAPKPVAAAPKPAPKPSSVTRATSSRSLLTVVVKSTAYNSLAAQTDSTPFVTATGARTRFGVVALSRDLLRRIPYGSIVRIEDLGSWSNGRGRGAYNRMLSGVNFIVEDTMHPRKRNTVDVWMPTRRAAIQWGARQIRVTVIRLGRR
jgi:3D (Asp-Asp-Asp) domain-containing protein